MNKKAVAVPEELFREILTYLGRHPFEQVSNLINKMLQCPIAEITETPQNVVPQETPVQ